MNTSSDPLHGPDRKLSLQQRISQNILVLAGGLGTAIQAHSLDEQDFRGERFRGHSGELSGNCDLLVITQPEIILDLHRASLAAGADIIETNTFTATPVSQGDYGLPHLTRELNETGARLARRAADEAEAGDPSTPRFVAGVLGPTNRTATISPNVNDPAFRDVTFDELRQGYTEAVRGLLQGGVDILMVETVFDTLNAKAALFAVQEIMQAHGLDIPVMISGTITDRSGRTLSGQTATAFWYSVSHAEPFAIGLNCALGAEDLRPYVAEIAAVADCNVSAHPNAGLPNAFGAYEETPESMAAHLGEWARSGLVNIVGGCCGTTPSHIEAIADAVRDVPPRQIPVIPRRLRLAGLEPFEAPV